MRSLLWDFDGVIIDSIDECLLTSYNAYLQYQGIYNEFIETLEDIPKYYREEFYRTRKYVRPAGEYFILHKAISSNIKIDSYLRFKELLISNAGAVADFQELFFLTRNEFKSKYPRYWFELHHSYPGIKTKWQELKRYFDFYIVSNKDLKSISEILDFFDLPINRDNIFGAEFSTDKKVIIRHILSTNNISAEKLFFIDDNYQHLLDLNGMGIKLFFACWGYGEIQDNTNEDIILLDLDTFNIKVIEEL
jgi:phosphoglycolate phosphatase-like HAD superfamily hydrolase